MRNTTLLPGENPQVEGSAVPVAAPSCHEATAPVATLTNGPQAVRPVAASFLYTWYSTIELALSVRPMIDVDPDSKLLKLEGSW